MGMMWLKKHCCRCIEIMDIYIDKLYVLIDYIYR